MKKGSIELVYRSTEEGWIYFDFYVEGLKIKFRPAFSAVFDPFPDMKIWLESICKGDKDTKFVFDTEGVKYEFRFLIEDDVELLIFSKFEDYVEEQDKENIFKVNVSRYDVVSEFYDSTKLFFRSKKFNFLEWKHETVGELMMRRIKIDNIDFHFIYFQLDSDSKSKYKKIYIEEFITRLMEIDDIKLLKIFRAFNWNSKWSSEHDLIYNSLGFDGTLNTLDFIIDNPIFQYTGNEVENIPFDSVIEKKKHIQDTLQNCCSLHNGSTWVDVESKEIEKYLKD